MGNPCRLSSDKDETRRVFSALRRPKRFRHGEQIQIFSFETGFEVTLQGGQRLSMNSRSKGAAPASAATPAAVAAASVTTAIVATEVSSDNGTLAVACVGSGVRWRGGGGSATCVTGIFKREMRCEGDELKERGDVACVASGDSGGRLAIRGRELRAGGRVNKGSG